MAKPTTKGSIGLSLYKIEKNTKTSIGRNPSSISLTKMNKSKRRSYKAYRGQGK